MFTAHSYFVTINFPDKISSDIGSFVDSHKSIFKSAVSFFSGTFISRITGLLRDISLAYAFGTSAKVAALMVAFRLSNFFRRMLGEGSMQAAFIPQFESLKAIDPNRAVQFFCDLKKLLSFVLIIIVIVSVSLFFSLTTYLDVKEWFNSEWTEVFSLTTFLMPSLFFICLYGLNSALLQCEKFYFIPSVAPVVFNLVWVVGVLSVMHFPVENAIIYLTGFIVFACTGQWLVTIPKTRLILSGYRTKKKTNDSFVSDDVKNLISPLFMSILGIASTQINSTLDPFFAICANSSGPAFLWYAIRLEQLPLSLFGIALSSALLPPLSRAIKNNQIEKYKFFLETSLRKTLVFIIPITFLYIVMGDSLINLLFGRGDFKVESVVDTTRCLWGYTFGLIPSGLILILAPGFYSLKSYRTPMTLTIISVILNILLNSFFVFYLKMGAEAIAFATSISAWFNCLFLMRALKMEVGVFFSSKTWIVLFTTVVLTFVGSTFSCIAEFAFFGQVTVLEIFKEEVPHLPIGFISQLFRLVVQAISFGIPILPLWIYEVQFYGKSSELRV